MPLIVRAPKSPVVAVWRAPRWQRVLFPMVGVALLVSAFWPYTGEPYEPIWLNVPVAAVFIGWAVRPKLMLHQDSLYIRGQILSRVIPIEEISAVEGGYGGLDIWWGDGHMSQASTIGEQTIIDGLPGSDGRRHSMRTLILKTRDSYLEEHGLPPRPDPREEDERRRSEFLERGWVEHNPPLIRDPDKGDPT